MHEFNCDIKNSFMKNNVFEKVLKYIKMTELLLKKSENVPMLLYAFECWTPRKEEKRIVEENSFYYSCYRIAC